MKHFSIKELTRTDTGLANKPSDKEEAYLYALVLHILDPLREAMGFPIKVNSGYRSPAVNRAVGGSRTSQHLLGQAVDFVCEDNARAFRYIREHLPFDQLIWEYGTDEAPKWVHVSYSPHRQRGQVLRCVGGRYIRMK